MVSITIKSRVSNTIECALCIVENFSSSFLPRNLIFNHLNAVHRSGFIINNRIWKGKCLFTNTRSTCSCIFHRNEATMRELWRRNVRHCATNTRPKCIYRCIEWALEAQSILPLHSLHSISSPPLISHNIIKWWMRLK